MELKRVVAVGALAPTKRAILDQNTFEKPDAFPKGVAPLCAGPGRRKRIPPIEHPVMRKYSGPRRLMGDPFTF
jgi:hypothetical protein